MARLFKQTYIKAKTVRQADGTTQRLPILMGGEPVRAKSKRWTIEYRDGQGKIRRKVAYTDKIASEQLAAELEKQAVRQASGLVDPTVEQATKPIQTHLDDYRAHLQGKKVSPKHLSETTRLLNAIVGSCRFGRLADIQSGPMVQFLSALDASGRSPRTRNLYFAALTAFVRWAVKDGRLPANPVETIGMLNEAKDVRRARRAATDDELRRLVGSAQRRPMEQAKYFVELSGKRLTDDDRRRIGLGRATMWKCFFLTGIREGELAALLWGDLDLDAGWVTVRAAVAKNSEEASIPLRPDLVADLERWQAERGRPSLDEKVFDVPKNLCRLLKKDLAFAGIPYKDVHGEYLDVHAFRHTTGTRLTSDPNLPTRTAQEFMRHCDQRLTTQTYTHKRSINLRAALDSLPDIPLDEGRPER
ncbi:MAG: tyrosine-type recombinase/integrase, partial [Planctomycetota bacterium]|nr:tyrosine-type recombinase/integrase [Planctomycetota bacterium]